MKGIARQKRSALAGSRERGRVLIITEETSVAFQAALEEAGLDVIGLSAGAAALVALRRARPHLVIAMPSNKGISTAELAHMLDQMEDGVPLILIGAEPATTQRRFDALAAGAYDYFQNPTEVPLLILRATQVIAIRQTMDKLRAEADLDSLTGLANRRRFRVQLKREVGRWTRYRATCALLILDIDHMKEINDKYGHPAGDLVIRHIAATLIGVSRDNDTAARVGGEEFALLLAGIDGEKAAGVAERLRAALAAKAVEGVGHISVSIGVAACPEHALSERRLYAASDEALYIAKNSGRNRVSVAPLMQENLPGV
ncbi:MAG: diguanylate cyclase [Acidobacteriota bacterium]